VESVESSFSWPCCRGVPEVLECPPRLFLAGRIKLDRNDLGDFGGGWRFEGLSKSKRGGPGRFAVSA